MNERTKSNEDSSHFLFYNNNNNYQPGKGNQYNNNGSKGGWPGKGGVNEITGMTPPAPFPSMTYGPALHQVYGSDQTQYNNNYNICNQINHWTYTIGDN